MKSLYDAVTEDSMVRGCSGHRYRCLIEHQRSPVAVPLHLKNFKTMMFRNMQYNIYQRSQYFLTEQK